MSEKTTDILREALALSVNERALLAAELIASVDGQPDADAEIAWAAEIERRARRARSGESAGKDWDEVRLGIERDVLGR